MTGFGSSEGKGFKVEIRALNHRFCEVIIKMPPNLFALENGIRKIVKHNLKRGRIEVSITQLNRDSIKKDLFTVNRSLTKAHINVLKKISAEFNIPFKVGVEFVAKIPGVIQQQEKSLDLTRMVPILRKLTMEAIDNLNYIRNKEAEEIKKDFISRIKKLEVILHQIKKHAPVVVNLYRRNLENRIKRMLKDDVNLDRRQILNEVTIFAERSDITEEIIRLGSHLKQFKYNVGQNMPIGRTLDFILQEMNREVNTIGAKANDYKISQKVVLIKAELEKLREQAQNIL